MGKYKKSVLEKVAEYKKQDVGFFTAQSRVKSAGLVEDHKNDHDLSVLYWALKEALKIHPNINSKFRDKVGKEALKQMVNLGVAAFELLMLIMAFNSIRKQDKAGAFQYGFLCLITERLEKYLESIIDQSKLGESIKKIQEEVLKTVFSPNIYKKTAGDLLTFLWSQKNLRELIKNIFNIGWQSSKSIFLNIGYFCHANASYAVNACTSLLTCKKSAK